jgi:hypothetical protein
VGAKGGFERQRAAHRLPATVLAVSRAVVHRSRTEFDEETSAADEHVRADGHRHHDRCPGADRAARSSLRVGGDQPSANGPQPIGKGSGHLVGSGVFGKKAKEPADCRLLCFLQRRRTSVSSSHPCASFHPSLRPFCLFLQPFVISPLGGFTLVRPPGGPASRHWPRQTRQRRYTRSGIERAKS